VIGATNRPYDVDSAILRRLPRTFEIGLPNAKSRLQILNIFLESHELTKDARAMIPAIANVTEGYSGSDLKELCKAAAMVPIREVTREASKQAVMGMKKGKKQKGGKKTFGPPPGTKIRPVSKEDFKEALEKVKKTGEAARVFRQQDVNPTTGKAQSMGVDMAELVNGMHMLQMLMSGKTNVSSEKEEANDEVPILN
jgi:ATPase family AAA domain-containing protein 1